MKHRNTSNNRPSLDRMHSMSSDMFEDDSVVQRIRNDTVPDDIVISALSTNTSVNGNTTAENPLHANHPV